MTNCRFFDEPKASRPLAKGNALRAKGLSGPRFARHLRPGLSAKLKPGPAGLHPLGVHP